MSTRKRKSKAVPVVITVTVVLALLCAACFFAGSWVKSQREAALASARAEAEAHNAEEDQKFAAAQAELEKKNTPSASLSWPTQKSEGWDILDLTTYPLEYPNRVTMSRADVMNTGLLLVNQWHSRIPGRRILTRAPWSAWATTLIGKFRSPTPAFPSSPWRRML